MSATKHIAVLSKSYYCWLEY